MGYKAFSFKPPHYVLTNIGRKALEIDKANSAWKGEGKGKGQTEEEEEIREGKKILLESDDLCI